MLKNILYAGILAVFALYWTATLLYCTPTNPARIELNGYMESFGKLFYQRWTFFTPPPKANERIFFQYVNARDSTDRFTVEVLKDINTERKKNPIFNVSQEVLEDIVLHHAYGLNNSLVAHRELIRRAFPDSSERFLNAETFGFLTDSVAWPASFKTLRNYAGIVFAKRNPHVRTSGYKFKIALVSVPIVPFRHRHEADYKVAESLLFETPLASLPAL